MKKFKWKLEITLEVADTWVEDGFDAKERLDDIQESIEHLIPYAYAHEFKVKARVISAPDNKKIREIQGYPS
jgi:hypothetical protein